MTPSASLPTGLRIDLDVTRIDARGTRACLAELADASDQHLDTRCQSEALLLPDV
jgi:hypothetical protein